MSFPTSPTVGQQHSEGGTVREWTGNVWKLVEPGVLRANATGAASVNVAGRGAVVLTLTGDVTSMAWTGWRPDSNVLQEVRVAVKQDAVGGRRFDWHNVSGAWTESLPAPSDLPSKGGDTVCEFRVSTVDGGTTVTLEPIGVTYEVDARIGTAGIVQVPATAAGGTATINHSLSLVATVELIDNATGRRVVADWWQQGADPAGPIKIDFADAIVAGQYSVRISGLAGTSAALVASTDQWDSLTVSASAATTLGVQLDWVGDSTDVQIRWGDGAVESPTSGLARSHTYATAYTGPVEIRWRKGTPVTNLTFTASTKWAGTIPSADLPRTLTYLSVASTSIAVTGNVADLPTGLTALLTQVSQSALVGDAAGFPRSLAAIALNNTSSAVTGDVADLPPNLTAFIAHTSSVAVSGATADLPRNLTTFYVQGTQSALTGDAAGLPVGLAVLRIATTPSAISGAMSNLPRTLTYLGVENTQSTLSGDTSDLPSGLTSCSLGTSPCSFTGSGPWNPAVLNALFDTIATAPAVGMTAAMVNATLSDLVDAGVTAPVTPKLIRLRGLHAAPDATSGGVDGLAAKATLQARGWNVSTN